MFSKACEYGLKATIYIATMSLEKKRVKIGEIVENTGSPEAFTAKVLGILVKYNIVSSHKGPLGGYDIDLKMMKETTISQIVSAIDGDTIYNGCALGLSECSDENPCPMHNRFADIRKGLKQMLETTSVYDLATNLKSGKTTLLR